MKKKLTKTLEELSIEQLIDLVNDVYEAGKVQKQTIDTCLASLKPIKLYKLLNDKICDLFHRHDFIDYYESDSFAQSLAEINEQIKKSILPTEHDLAVLLCQKIINRSEDILEHADDSNGAIVTELEVTFEILDEGFANSNMACDEIAEYILETYCNSEYGVNDNIIHYMSKTLKTGVDIPLEKLVLKSQLEDNKRQSILTTILDARKDVDGFIALMKREHDFDSVDGKNINSNHIILSIAVRLIDACRGSEAIAWLEKVTDDNRYFFEEKNNLLIDHTV